MAFTAINSPLRHVRKAIYYYNNGYNLPWFSAGSELLSWCVFLVACWFAYTHIPEVHEFFDHFFANWQTMWNNIIESIRHSAAHSPKALEPIARLIRP